MAKQFFVTEEGKAALEKEYEHLVTVGRKDAAEKLKEARSYGDLSENSEYDEAKNDQAILEARIADLEVMLKNAVVVHESEIDSSVVNIGSFVTVNVERPDGSVRTNKCYEIVGTNQADPRHDKISDDSPIGKALMGSKIGSVVEVETPGGINKLIIIDISREKAEQENKYGE
ncbi:MAG: transcription elongation factor GreA [Clostridia bacterium]|nr:transcription elongation factor GreA [Clostridia bacterium]